MTIRFFLRHRGQYIELADGRPLTVGRGADAEIQLDSEDASREHCRFVLRGGVVRVHDLGSRNGVRVNGQFIEGEAELQNRDVITVGKRHFSLLRRGTAPVSAPSLPRFDEVDADDRTEAAGSPLEMFADGAADALAEGDLLVAEMGVRNLLGSIRALAARRRAPTGPIVERALAYALDLAEATGDRKWLDDARRTASAAGGELPASLTRRAAELDERL